MGCQLGSAKINSGRIWVPNELQDELKAIDGDKLIFTKIECGIVVTKNEVS